MEFEKLEQTELQTLHDKAQQIAKELIAAADLHVGQIVVVGCSTSEILGCNFGTFSHPDAGEAVFKGLYAVFKEKGIYLAAQCCEHLNRAIITEAAAVPGAEIVNAVPQPKAGGSFATAAYRNFEHPVVLEEIRADAGIDVGGTMIGMHLKKVAVPLKIPTANLGKAILLCARTRPKFIGGSRAIYDTSLIGSAALDSH